MKYKLPTMDNANNRIIFLLLLLTTLGNLDLAVFSTTQVHLSYKQWHFKQFVPI